MSVEDFIVLFVSIAVSVFVARPFFTRDRNGKDGSRGEEN